jgi:hypothetical protein
LIDRNAMPAPIDIAQWSLPLLADFVEEAFLG